MATASAAAIRRGSSVLLRRLAVVRAPDRRSRELATAPETASPARQPRQPPSAPRELPEDVKGESASPQAAATPDSPMTPRPDQIGSVTGTGLAAQFLLPSTLENVHQSEDAKEQGIREADDDWAGKRRRTFEREPESTAQKILTTIAFGSLLGGTAFFGRPQGPDETWAPVDVVKRAFNRAQSFFDQVPVNDKLLPPELPEPYRLPYTIVINLDDTLIKSEWDIKTGWRVAKRPGVDYFLAYLAQHFEVVLFTTQPSMNAEPIIQKLDPYGYIMYKLYREHARKLDGEYVKDLSMLNRDLKKVIILDTDPNSYRLQPENAIPVKPWDGNPNDDWLVAIIPFLEAIAYSQPDDVRAIVSYWQKKENIPLEYAKYEAELRERHIAEWRAQQEARKRNHRLSWLLSTARQSDEPPPHYLDLMRQHSQEAFKHHLELVKEQAAAQQQVEKEMQDDAMRGLTVLKMFSESVSQVSPEVIAERQQEIYRRQQQKLQELERQQR